MELVELRAEAVATGRPHYVPEDREDHIAYIHADDESAVRSARANREDYGHPSWTEEREGFTITVVNLGPSIAEARRAAATSVMIVTATGAEHLSWAAEGDEVRIEESLTSAACGRFVAVYKDPYIDPIAYISERSVVDYLRSR